MVKTRELKEQVHVCRNKRHHLLFFPYTLGEENNVISTWNRQMAGIITKNENTNLLAIIYLFALVNADSIQRKGKKKPHIQTKF